jgi:formyl-CoA transferase
LSGELPLPARAPFLGEHGEELLRDVLGYDAQRLQELRAEGAFGADG